MNRPGSRPEHPFFDPQPAVAALSPFKSPQGLITLAPILLFAVTLLASGPREDQWKEVDEAVDRGLPQTAIEQLEPIIENAMRDGAHAEAIKAISLKIVLEAEVQGGLPEEKISRMRSEIERAPAEMKPVMQAIQANWLWQYFQHNRWRFMQRTATAAAPGEDLSTWDLPRILREIDLQFTRALDGAESLRNVPVERYDALFLQGTAADAYRPTVYDVLAHNALRFYSAGEQAAAMRQDAFDLRSDGPIFAPTQDFLAWRPTAPGDEDALTLRAVRLFQDLLRFHQDDQDRSAFLDTDLARLQFGFNQAVGEEKPQRYRAALRRFAEANPEHPISARGWHELATVLHSEGELLEAHQAASRGLAAFPDSIGGRRCHNLIQEIEAPSSQITTERVWGPPAASIEVQYRNVTQVHFRLVRFQFEELALSGAWPPGYLDQQQQQRMLARPSVRSWSIELPPTDDYQSRVESIPAPRDLDAGSYVLIASHNADFSTQENEVSLTEVWISNLALITRSAPAAVEGFVLAAESGEPQPGAEVKAWRWDRTNRYTPLPTTRTDTNGKFRFEGSSTARLILLVVHQGQSVSSTSQLTSHSPQPTRATEQTRLFTDRAIYRPGQTVRYKGICFRVDQQQDDYATLSERTVTLVFSDANGNEIERVQHRTNDFGSFSGSVTAPRDRLTGRMTLRVEHPQGQAGVLVEEYKRPKFQVELDAPEQAASLGQPVQLRGRAVAFTGAAIGNATVQWRVVREVRYPMWWRWERGWSPPHRQPSQEIAHGSARTSADGRFDIEFVAKPDLAVAEKAQPTFTFRVDADVVDSSGETRSGQRRIRVGYVSLEATMTASEWQTENEPIDLSVRTRTLDGEGRAARGSIQVFSLQQPDRVLRPPLPGGAIPIPRRPSEPPPEPDPADPNSWADEELQFESEFVSDAAGNATITVPLSAGIYRARLQTRDPLGREVSAILPMQVLDPQADRLNIRLPHLVRTRQDSLEPGSTFQAVWGTGYDTGRAFVEIEHRGQLLQSYWTEPNRTQALITQPIIEEMRGGFNLRVTSVHENRASFHSQQIDVPWSDRELKIRWERFISKLEPAVRETWTAIITGPEAERRAVEMVATLYDASLDTFAIHRWPESFGVFRQDFSPVRSRFENESQWLRAMFSNWSRDFKQAPLTYRDFPPRILHDLGPQLQMMRRGMSRFGGEPEAFFMDAGMPMAAAAPMEGEAVDAESQAAADIGDGSMDRDDVRRPSSDLSRIPLRRDLNETAFFFPHLRSADDGTVSLQFTMPESLTEWHFLGFAHDRELRTGLLSDSAVTAKELMVQPNPPRFLREGDEIEFTVKVSNQSPTRHTGTARLTFAEARTEESVDELLDNQDPERAFELASGESTSLSWRVQVPEGIGLLIYRAVASSGRLSDGEEGYLPVLPQKVLVTEALPLSIRGQQSKTFKFRKLLESEGSDSIRHQSLTVQMASNPSWYAVLALPYLMEIPHASAERAFSQLYANSLGRRIVTSDPKIQRLFEQWRATPALDSPLEKNEELKGILIEETPWVRQAAAESQARRNVGLLFDENRMRDEADRALSQLSQMQLEDGSWPWFPGGRSNQFMTLHITTGLGRLSHLGVQLDLTPASRSLPFLDQWMTEQSTRITESDREKPQLSPLIALYLYGRSFFVADHPIAAEHRDAFQFWTDQAKRHWVRLDHRQSQAHLAIALHRLGERNAARDIMASIKERSVVDEELGRYWRDQERSWWWYAAPIETQALMIEAFDEVLGDTETVEACQVWLLKQKQTQGWTTSKATADAVYALILRGTDALASDQLVSVVLGDTEVEPESVEPGTGFFEKRWREEQVSPQQAEIVVTKHDPGVAWGGVYWQYFDNLANVTADDGTALQLKKELYVKRATPRGPELSQVDGPVEVGDELVVRLELRADRDMEFVHLKDHRGSGTEPLNVLSHYRFQDGLAYYESTRDTASHFYIDYLPKGTYVFEYSTRVQLRGEYQTGFANVQCMYAPEFNSHSQSLPVTAR